MNSVSWAVWAAILFFQNISFTYVSRARSSGSIVRHLKASVFSNGIWIFSQMIMLGPMFDYLTGKHGRIPQLEAATVYTVATVSGSLFAHWLAMKTEKGKNAVGHSKLYAQIPVAEWAAIKRVVAVLSDEHPVALKHLDGHATGLVPLAFSMPPGTKFTPLPEPPENVEEKKGR